MDLLSFESVEPLDIRPLPLIEDPGGADVNVAGICECLQSSQNSALSLYISPHLASLEVFERDCPFALVCMPCCSFEFMSEFDVFIDAILPGDTLKVLLDLMSGGVVLAPLRVILESILVAGTWNVTTNTRVSSSEVQW